MRNGIVAATVVIGLLSCIARHHNNEANSEGIYGKDDRLDVADVKDKQVLQNATAAAAMVHRSQVSKNCPPSLLRLPQIPKRIPHETPQKSFLCLETRPLCPVSEKWVEDCLV